MTFGNNDFDYFPKNQLIAS